MDELGSVDRLPFVRVCVVEEREREQSTDFEKKKEFDFQGKSTFCAFPNRYGNSTFIKRRIFLSTSFQIEMR